MLTMVRLRGKDQKKNKASGFWAWQYGVVWVAGSAGPPLITASHSNRTKLMSKASFINCKARWGDEEVWGLSRMRFGEFAQLPAEVTRFAVCVWTRVSPVTRVTGRGTTLLCVSSSVVGSGATNKHEIYDGQSNENLKSAKKIRTTARLFVSFSNDTHGLKSGLQVVVRHYIEKWSHCVPFVFNKLWDETYLRFSCDPPS